MGSKDFAFTRNLANPAPIGNSRVTYTANFRNTSSPFALSFVFGAGGAKQFATIYHPATSTKLVRLKDARFYLQSSSAASTYLFELVPLTSGTAPATGNPAITPKAHNPGVGASDSVCLALPTTAGSTSGNGGWGSQELAIGVTGAGETTQPPTIEIPIILYHHDGYDETEPLIMRANNAEGYAIQITSSAIATLAGTAIFTFTEQPG